MLREGVSSNVKYTGAVLKGAITRKTGLLGFSVFQGFDH